MSRFSVWVGVVLIVAVALCAVGFAGCTSSAYSATDQKFIDTGNEYIQALQPVADGTLAAMKNHNDADKIYYERQGIATVDKYLPIISGYKVSEKVQPMKDELMLAMTTYRDAQDNYIKAASPQDVDQKLEYMNAGNRNLTSSNEHIKRMNTIMDNLNK